MLSVRSLEGDVHGCSAPHVKTFNETISSDLADLLRRPPPCLIELVKYCFFPPFLLFSSFTSSFCSHVKRPLRKADGRWNVEADNRFLSVITRDSLLMRRKCSSVVGVKAVIGWLLMAMCHVTLYWNCCLGSMRSH